MRTRNGLVLDHEIQGAINFRDLGGLPAGDMFVRRGLVFRSAMTHHISADGIQALASRYAIRTVVDFRNDQELSDDGLADWSAAGISHRHYPVHTETVLTPEERAERMKTLLSGGLPWEDLYADMARSGGPAFSRFLRAIADDAALSLVFQCSGGRDRTGVGAALLLSVLGVERPLIAADYARTGELLRPHTARFVRVATQSGIDPEQLAEMVVSTRPEAMLSFLAFLDAEYGSVEGYLAAIGVETPVLAALRNRLLEPAA